MNRFNEALEQLPQAAPQAFEDWFALHLKGMANFKQGKLGEAITCFKYGLDHNPFLEHRKYFSSGLAMARLRQNDVNGALADLQNDQSRIANILRLDIFGRKHDEDNALRAYSLIRPNAPRVIELTEELAIRARLKQSQAQGKSDQWVFEREAELLLQYEAA